MEKEEVPACVAYLLVGFAVLDAILTLITKGVL